MNLRDRRRSERLDVDAGERAEPDVLGDRRLQLGEWHYRGVVGQRGKLLDVDVGHQLGSRRKKLAELHIRHAELLERTPKLARTLARCGRARADDAELAQQIQYAR